MWKPVGTNFGTIAVNSRGNTLYRSARLYPDYLNVYIKNKIWRTIILREKISDEESHRLFDLGLVVYHFPMSDSKPDINVEQIKQILSVMDNVADNLVVSCEGGRHRTGLISACYLVAYEDLSKEEAWEFNKEHNWYDKAFLGFGKDHSELRKWFFKYDIKSLKVTNE